MPKPDQQRSLRTPLFLLTALGMLLHTSTEAQQGPPASIPPQPARPQTVPASSPPAAPVSCDNPVDVPFAGLFVATYIKDRNEIKNLDQTLATLTEQNQDLFHLKIGSSTSERINGNYYGDDLTGLAYKSPCKESCEERNKRIKEIDSKEMDSKGAENYLLSNFGNACIDALKLSECKGGYNTKCLSAIEEKCGPCQFRQEALRNLAYQRISPEVARTLTKAEQPFLLISISFNSNAEGKYSYVIQRFWPKIENQETKQPIISPVLPVDRCPDKPDKCCWIRLLNEAITEATKSLPPRKQVVPHAEKPTATGTPTPSPAGTQPTSPTKTGIQPISTSSTKLGTSLTQTQPTSLIKPGPATDPGTQHAQPAGGAGRSTLFSQRSGAMHIALGTLSTGLAVSAVALTTLGILNLAPAPLGSIDLGYHCGTRMDMSCGAIQPNLNSEVRIFAGLTAFFAVGVAATVGYEATHRKSPAAQAAAVPPAAVLPVTVSPVTIPPAEVSPPASPPPVVPPALAPSPAALNPAQPPPAPVDSARKAPQQPPPQPRTL